MMPHGWPWPYHYAIPVRMTRAELRWLAWLWLAWAYAEERAEQFTRSFWAKYTSMRRIEELCLRPSPIMERLQRELNDA